MAELNGDFLESPNKTEDFIWSAAKKARVYWAIVKTHAFNFVPKLSERT